MCTRIKSRLIITFNITTHVMLNGETNMNVFATIIDNARNRTHMPSTVKTSTGRNDTVVKSKGRMKQFVNAADYDAMPKGGQLLSYANAALSFEPDEKFDLEQLLERAEAHHGLTFSKNGDKMKNVRYYSSFLQKQGFMTAA